jgi:hypothetical protein
MYIFGWRLLITIQIRGLFVKLRGLFTNNWIAIQRSLSVKALHRACSPPRRRRCCRQDRSRCRRWAAVVPPPYFSLSSIEFLRIPSRLGRDYSGRRRPTTVAPPTNRRMDALAPPLLQIARVSIPMAYQNIFDPPGARRVVVHASCSGARSPRPLGGTPAPRRGPARRRTPRG